MTPPIVSPPKLPPSLHGRVAPILAPPVSGCSELPASKKNKITCGVAMSWLSSVTTAVHLAVRTCRSNQGLIKLYVIRTPGITFSPPKKSHRRMIPPGVALLCVWGGGWGLLMLILHLILSEIIMCLGSCWPEKLFSTDYDMVSYVLFFTLCRKR